MYRVKTNFVIVEKLSDLPNLKNRKEIFCDVETANNSGLEKLGGLYPWKGDKTCGFGITADNISDIWYVPIRHTCPAPNNLPVESVMRWLEDTIQSADQWINHNIKFDAIMLAVGDRLSFKDTELVCTLVAMKLLDSDRIGYSLKPLCEEVLGYDTGSLDKVKAYLDSIKSKSYADVPIDILGEYCCDDLQMNKQLYRYIQERMPESVQNVWATERKLTSVLFDMEMRGMCIDRQECLVEGTKALRKMIDTSTRITELTEREFTNSNDCIYDILINLLGLPVLATIKEKDGYQWIDTGRPSFDKDALALYKVHPMVTYDKNINEVVNCILEYRTESTFHGLFIENFITLNENGIIHPSYNQVVRTGRMSCSRPNSQQQNKRSKALIHPHKGYGYVSNDYSQIEYRLIVHYIKDETAIAAYNENADTDFHEWVATLMGGIDRDSGKTLNFGMAYGAGKKRVTAGLMANEMMMEIIGKKINQLVEQGQLDPKLQDRKFKELCKEYANDAYNRYHERLPGIKITSRQAMINAKLRGYVFNAYGRQRHLTEEYCHKAFNTVIQGCAADIMKERMVALSPRWNPTSKELDLHIVANVHDENLDEVPLEILHDESVHNFICNTLQQTSIPFRVPIRTGLGISASNWAEAAGKESQIDDKGVVIAGKIR